MYNKLLSTTTDFQLNFICEHYMMFSCGERFYRDCNCEYGDNGCYNDIKLIMDSKKKSIMKFIQKS